MKTPETGKDTNVLRKTPEEIKKGLECCGDYKTESCDGCPYEVKECEEKQALCLTYLALDALAYIQQLESKLAQAERERDALLRIVQDAKPRRECKHYKKCLEKTKTSIVNWMACPVCQKFEWRGPCLENTKEADSGGETTSASDA